MENKVSWQTIEYLHREKTADWYWVVGIITLTLAIITTILNNIIFALLIIISSFILTILASKKPEQIIIELDEKEIKIGTKNYKYKEFESFWVETRDNNERIIFKSNKIMSPFLVVLIDEINPEQVKNFLNQKLKEEEISESFFEKILIYFGF